MQGIPTISLLLGLEGHNEAIALARPNPVAEVGSCVQKKGSKVGDFLGLQVLS